MFHREDYWGDGTLEPDDSGLNIAERALFDVQTWLGFRGHDADRRYLAALATEKRAIFKRATRRRPK